MLRSKRRRASEDAPGRPIATKQSRPRPAIDAVAAVEHHEEPRNHNNFFTLLPNETLGAIVQAACPRSSLVTRVLGRVEVAVRGLSSAAVVGNGSSGGEQIAAVLLRKMPGGDATAVKGGDVKRALHAAANSARWTNLNPAGSFRKLSSDLNSFTFPDDATPPVARILDGGRVLDVARGTCTLTLSTPCPPHGVTFVIASIDEDEAGRWPTVGVTTGPLDGGVSRARVAAYGNGPARVAKEGIGLVLSTGCVLHASRVVARGPRWSLRAGDTITLQITRCEQEAHSAVVATGVEGGGSAADGAAATVAAASTAALLNFVINGKAVVDPVRFNLHEDMQFAATFYGSSVVRVSSAC